MRMVVGILWKGGKVFLRWKGRKDYRTRMTGSTRSAGYLKVKWRCSGACHSAVWDNQPRNKIHQTPKTVSSRPASRDPVFWKQPSSPETNHLQTTLLRHPGLRAGIQSFRNNHPTPKQTTSRLHYCVIPACEPGSSLLYKIYIDKS